MKTIPLNAQTEALARRVIWFEEPAKALADPVRFMAYAFSYATHEDMKTLWGLLDEQDLRSALRNAPPGIIDPRSWAFWNSKLGNWPPPPMPQRRL
ncbi:MAG: hypothetical protein IT482_03315 [Gammaproteobacteria bacterium]|nr:hypothetical protein [Gammaproteobacteria bacterium]